VGAVGAVECWGKHPAKADWERGRTMARTVVAHSH
jgi:hypothetical protein